MPEVSWSGRLVVATPTLVDPNFLRTVVLLLQHEPDQGAIGVVLTRPSGTALGEVLPRWHDLAAEPAVVFGGGPVQLEAAVGLARVRPGTPASETFAPLSLLPLGTVNLDAEPFGEVQAVRVFAGYAGWSAGQLEAEVDEGAWWVLDALPGDAFDGRPDRLWQQVLRRQGPPLAFAAAYPDDPRLN